MSIDQFRHIVNFMSKHADVDLAEYASGGQKPYPEGSGQDKKDTRTGISLAWEANEAVDRPSSEAEPPMLNQEGGAQP